MKTPWIYAETGTEYAHQVALFMWCNMAASFGLTAANTEKSYYEKGAAQAFLLYRKDQIEPLKWLYANKNAVGRNNPVVGARNVAEGVKAGVPDLFLPVPRPQLYHKPSALMHGLYIELKRPAAQGKRKGVVGSKQDDWADYLKSAGYAVEVCYGWETARDALLQYLGVRHG